MRPPRPKLLRVIGRWTLTALVINCIIGSGIFGLPDDLDRLMEYFKGMRTGTCPMYKIVPFAIVSTRRQEEITLCGRAISTAIASRRAR